MTVMLLIKFYKSKWVDLLRMLHKSFIFIWYFGVNITVSDMVWGEDLLLNLMS